MKRKLLLACLLTAASTAQEVPRFELPQGSLQLKRPTHGGVFFDVAGPRSAFFGLENGPVEGWIYPLKVFQDLELSFRLEGYPAELLGRDLQRQLEVHPEYSVLTYSHSAFTARQILFCPRSQATLVCLLDLDSSLPMTVTTTLRPRLRLMWPGALSTPSVAWDESHQFYRLSEESGTFAAVIGSPGARDLACLPYQEEPKDTLLRMEIPVPLERSRKQFVPVIAARTPEEYQKTLAQIPALMQEVAQHYQHKRQQWVRVQLPDTHLQQAYDWSLVGMDKGMVQSPLFAGPGYVAGFRTSGESERPGFAWFFGRDAMWTGMAALASGDRESTRQALDFLARQQRADGKIPHEISQSAPLVDWFKKYAYAWASSDATPLFLIVHGELFQALGDRHYLSAHWPTLKKAWAFTSATDRDGDGLMENTQFGHAWVEGGALYPAHQELYLQGVFLEAARHMQGMARAMDDPALAAQAQQRMSSVQQACERTYWLHGRGHYAFATSKAMPKTAEPGPQRARRQRRLDELAQGGVVEEDTVLPSVPMMWGWLQPDRAQQELDHLTAASMSTDWGARLLSNQSQLYDPLAYHYGSVWPLFTGWVSLAGYRYGRPHVGWQALASNAALTEFDTLGYLTELLSGDYCSAFGRSSHHQVWSEAMVTLPLLRGLLGLQIEEQGSRVHFSPQPPADWKSLKVSQILTAQGTVSLEYEREPGRRRIRWQGPEAVSYRFTLSFPRDAVVERKTDLHGEVQQCTLESQGARGEVVISCQEGCELVLPAPVLENGARSQGLRLIRCMPGPQGLHLIVEGRPGRSYSLGRRGRRLGQASSAVGSVRDHEGQLLLRLEPASSDFVRLDLLVPYSREN
jgi:glycogen debranching enzyme